MQRDVLRCRAEGGRVELRMYQERAPARALELCLLYRVGTHRAFLCREELELLRGLPGLAEALGAPGPRRTG